MAGEQAVASTGALEKYLTRIQKQVRQLGLMKANPILNAVDLITGKIDAIGVRFEQMTSKMKMLSIDISMKPNWSNFEQAGTEAGKVFTDAFIAAFDSDKLAQKAKDSLESIEVNVNLGSSGGGIEWSDKAADLAVGVLGGLLAEVFSKGGKTLWTKYRNRKGAPQNQSTKADVPQITRNQQRTIERNNKHSRNRRENNRRNRNRSAPPVANEPEVIQPAANPKGSKFRKIFEAGKKIISKMRSSSNFAMLGISESSAGRSPSNAGGQGRQGSGSSRSFGKRSYTNLSPQSKFSATEPATSNAVKSLTANTRLAAGPLAKSALKLTGKLFRPLGLISDAMAITGAETVEERNKAIGSAVGGWGGAAAGAAAGAAIGSVVPVIGTAIGGLVGGAIGGLGGSAVGEFVGGKAKEATNKIKGWFGFGKKKKKEEDPVALPAPPEPKPVALPSPTVTNPLVSPFSQVPATPPAMPINVNVPYGAIQITVHNPDIDYEQISAQIGSRFATSIQQAMENRA